MSLDQFNLDAAQKRVVTFTDGPLVVYAGPGSGKTRTLIARTAYLINECNLPANGIYLSTFTRKARAEMKERLSEALSPSVADFVNVKTIDATAFQILKAGERVRETDASKEFKIGDDELLYHHFTESAKIVGFKPQVMHLRDAWKKMKSWQMRGGHKEGIPTDLKDLISYYRDRINEARLWDVSDLVPLAIDALKKDDGIIAGFNIHAFLLDEYQDTTVMQFEFIKMLLKDCRNFFAVGAPSQSIYSFRMADPNLLDMEMERFFGEIEHLKLTSNYRSGEMIFKSSASLVKGADDVKGIVSVKKEGDVYFRELSNVNAEANFVAKAIKTIKADNPALRNKEIAVLARQWSDLTLVETALGNMDIPFEKGSDTQQKFWDTPDIVAMIGYLRAIQSIRDAQGAKPNLDGALDVIINTPPRGIGPSSHSLILNNEAELTWEGLIAAMGSPNLRPQVKDALSELFDILVGLANSDIQDAHEMTENILGRTGWLEAISDDLNFYKTRRLLETEFSNQTKEFDNIPDLLKFAYSQNGNWNMDGVLLSSVHAAKGLEWKVVFIVGLNEGFFPSSHAQTTSVLQEEARVAHVATSRAMDLLLCTWTRNRGKTGSKAQPPVKPSRFLAGIKEFGEEFDENTFSYPGSRNSPRVDYTNPFRVGKDSNETFYGS